jgi:hypothetical protein
MKAKLKEDYTLTSLPSLIQAIKMMWVKGLPLAYFQKLARSMPRPHQGGHVRQRSRKEVLMCLKMLCKEIYFLT